MVAIIKTSASVRRPFQYNENKLKAEAAVLLLAANYPGVLAEESSRMRLKYLQKLARLNSRTKVNSVHISLNFAPDEKLERNRLIQISKEYMSGIGFGEQPYLVYQHTDAGHPHVHIVSTNIQLDGRRIPLHNIGKLKSEPTRKAIEKQFGLVPAEQQKKGVFLAKQVDLSRVEYGKSETKRAIGNVLQQVLKNYHYTSLPELNAVLKGYNILADRGKKESRIFRNRGLVYRVLDEKGEKVGVPIKSSSFHFPATLKAIESIFLVNENTKDKHASGLRATIDLVLMRSANVSLGDFEKSLERQGVALVLRKNQEGRIYGLTYVDHRSRAVFNGSALGKSYSAKGLLDRLNATELVTHKKENSINQSKKRVDSISSVNNKKPIELDVQQLKPVAILQPIYAVIKPQESYSYLPFEWRKRKKRKKRRISN
ncbi:relaxase/mobilization nuclease domain-containing protein [Algoriphagus vanfongensis]|uniref:relaxase/mobilization nuclease domain-containing protein n=1 Tax=Algoriphagus vanfongensis TaxID=426371 RepID=UPI000414C79E|nr:relaxase/mobilization nuclease domain-containing protein [Algoriphagus vanfongensis]